MGIKEHFDNVSENYDKQRKLLLPCFDDYYGLPLSLMDFPGDCPKILDIGTGTGIFASFVLDKYPNAEFTLIDLSDKMLDIAKERFSGKTNFTYICADYTKFEFEESFDIIISALSIHHLTALQKEELYQKCYSMLSENGIFINADQVLSPYPQAEKLFSDLWRKQVENSGLSREEVDMTFDRVSFDNPSTLSDQLLWLKNAGFKYTDCLYKYYHFCVLFAQK